MAGGHTVGNASCSFFQDRLYDFQNTGKPDPNMDRTLRDQLSLWCPQGTTGTNSVFLDQNSASSMTVDKSYYEQIMMKRGILQIDQQLAISGLTKGTVKQMAESSDFGHKFGEAMVKLGRVEVITEGRKGEIRTFCSAVNS